MARSRPRRPSRTARREASARVGRCVTSQYCASKSQGARASTTSAPARTARRAPRPATSRASRIATWASGSRPSRPSRSTRAGRSWPSPMSAVKISTRTGRAYGRSPLWVAGSSRLGSMHAEVLVTGGSGFIGSHVVDRLLAAGHRPRIFDVLPSPYHPDLPAAVADLEDVDALGAALDGCDAVIHLAASADVNEVLADPLEAERRN